MGRGVSPNVNTCLNNGEGVKNTQNPVKVVYECPLSQNKTFGSLIFLNKLECIIDITLFWTFGGKEDFKMEVYRGEFGFGGGFGFLMSGIILAISFIIGILCCYKKLYGIRSKVTSRLTRFLCYRVVNYRLPFLYGLVRPYGKRYGFVLLICYRQDLRQLGGVFLPDRK